MSKGTPVTAGLTLAPLSALALMVGIKSKDVFLTPGLATLWPRLKRGKCLVNWDGKLMVRDWEVGAWLQCLASLPPCSLMAHAVLWPCPTITLPWVFSPLVRTCSATFWFSRYILFQVKKALVWGFFYHKHTNFNIFQGKISQIRALSCDFLRHKSKSWPIHS